MEELLPVILSLAGKFIDNFQSRRNYDYNFNRTNIPAQVAQMREAGLNPALAYGQVSAPQGGEISSRQLDFGEAIRDYQNSKEARSQREYVDAQTEVFKAQRDYLINKAKFEAAKAENEANLGRFDVEHQQERYNLEITGKGLVNAGKALENEGYQTENVGRIIKNDILSIERDIAEFNREIAKIDAGRHSDYVDSEIQRIVANTFLMMRQSWALKQTVPAQCLGMWATYRKLRQETNVQKQEELKLKLANEVEQYLRRNGMQGYVLHGTDINNIIGKILQSFGNATDLW